MSDLLIGEVQAAVSRLVEAEDAAADGARRAAVALLLRGGSTAELEVLLSRQSYLLAERITLADIALFPFVRQFAFVDKDWFDQSPYPKLRAWLEQLLNSKLFLAAMKKSPPWQDGDSPISL